MIVGRHPRLGAASAAVEEGRGHRVDGAVDRRQRHRQGALRTGGPRVVSAGFAGSFPGGQLRRDPRRLDGERALRSRERRLHRRHATPEGALRAGGGRHDLPGRDRRAQAGGAGQGAAGTRGAHFRAGRRRAPDPCRRPRRGRHQSRAHGRWCGKGTSGRTSITVSTCSRSPCRLCERGRATFRTWRGICCPRSPGASASRPRRSLRTLSICWRTQPWPGNVRQLANVLERAVILGEGQSAAKPPICDPVLVPEPVRGASASAIRAGPGWKPTATSVGRRGSWASAIERLQRWVRESRSRGVIRSIER